MMKHSNHKKWISEGIALLFVLLLVYAAGVKLLDFTKFSRQLSQSPLWPEMVGRVLAWVVPVVELAIAFALIWPKYKTKGLYAGTGLMVLFTGYIVYILGFSGYIPCACGGVIEDLSWKQHLWFNLVFVGLGVLGIVLKPEEKK